MGPLKFAMRLIPKDHVQSLQFLRWGDPENSGTFGAHVFGGKMTEHRTFNGVTNAPRGSVGWHFQQAEWARGEFLGFTSPIYSLWPEDDQGGLGVVGCPTSPVRGEYFSTKAAGLASHSCRPMRILWPPH